MKPVNIKSMRITNVSLVLDTIRRMGPISRYDISKITKLSPSAVSSIVENLINVGIVKETPAKVTKVGRRPIELTLNETGYYPIGIEIEKDKITGILMALSGKILKSKVINLNTTNVEEVLDTVIEVYRFLIEDVNKEEIIGIGVAVPGTINRKEGVCIFSPNLGWRNVNIKDYLGRYIKDFPLFIEHIIKAVTYGEMWYGAGIGKDNIICVRVGSGVSAGFVLDGRLYRGPNDRAGEFGHTVIERNGKKCKCGSYGCLETYVSTQVLYERVYDGIQRNAYTKVNIENKSKDEILDEIIEAGRNGDRFVLNIFEEMGTYLGLGIANLINLFNPEVIIIAGGLSKAGDLLLDPVKRVINLHAFPPIPEIMVTKLGALTGPIGAASEVIEETLLKKIFEKVEE
ncbi:MAG: ROK family transcriptional regulator [Dictyoglomus thermophilum]|nr:ROK family protein [Dictyoglomus thermophilum]MCX7720443.1 ROK family transcriptional regulator [Dictyoglomus thermophilum]